MSISEDSVIPAAFGLEHAPPIDEREFVEIDLEHVDDRYRSSLLARKECQHCGDAVELLEPHAYACLWAEDSIGRIMYKIAFCDRECWLDCLGRD